MWGAVPQLPEQEVGAAFPPLQSIPAMHHEGQAELWGHLTLTQVLVTPLSPRTYQIAMFSSVSGLHQCGPWAIFGDESPLKSEQIGPFRPWAKGLGFH